MSRRLFIVELVNSFGKLTNACLNGKVSEMAQPTYDIRDRAEWILCLLYAPDAYGRNNTPLYGKTRLQKATFLLDRKLEEKFGVKTGFNFKPDKYGPFDKGVYTAVTLLQNEGLLSVKEPSEHDEKYDLVQYQLTEKGEAEAQDQFEELPEEQQDLVVWVKNKHALQRLGRLLTYVYNEYPDMTVESELV